MDSRKSGKEGERKSKKENADHSRKQLLVQKKVYSGTVL